MVPVRLMPTGSQVRLKRCGILLVVAIVKVPIFLAYIAYAYWVFRGKVVADGGYY